MTYSVSPHQKNFWWWFIITERKFLASYYKVIHDFIHFLLLLQRADTTCNVLSLVWRNIDGFKRSTEHRRPISMRTLFFRGRTSVLLWNNSAGTPDSPAGVTDGRLTQFPWIYRLSFLLKFSEYSRVLLKLGCRKKAHQKNVILFFFFKSRIVNMPRIWTHPRAWITGECAVGNVGRHFPINEKPSGEFISIVTVLYM